MTNYVNNPDWRVVMANYVCMYARLDYKVTTGFWPTQEVQSETGDWDPNETWWCKVAGRNLLHSTARFFLHGMWS